MINVRVAANNAVQVVNPDIVGLFLASTGSAPNASFKQVPTYAAGVDVRLQVQAISARDLKHMEGLNIEGVLRSVHMYGDSQGVVRVAQHGGDLLRFPEVPGGTTLVWKVVKVIETWPDWCHVVVNLQTDSV